MACQIPYIQSAQLSETEKARLEGIHMTILEDAKSSGAFRREANRFVTIKNSYPKATEFVSQIVAKFGTGIATLPSIGNGKHSLNINVLPLSVEKQEVLFNKEQGIGQTVASDVTVKKIKSLLDKMGIDLKGLQDYAKVIGIQATGINALADLAHNVIAIAEGKENETLTEEMVHIATYFIEHKDPKLVTEMISKIDRFKIYRDTLNLYKGFRNYQLENGKPDIRKIKKEAVDKLIAEVIINKSENLEQYPELAKEENRSLVYQMWQDILDWIKGQYRKANIDVFEQVATSILSGEVVNEEIEGIENATFYNIERNTSVNTIYDKILDI